MSEVAPAGGGPNRLFIVLALGLVGLLIIGLVALAVFMFIIQPMMRPAAVAPTPTRVVIAVTTPTRAPLTTATNTLPPTNTPPPTATFVVQPPAGGGTPASGGTVTTTVTVTSTVGAGTGTPGGGMPDTGIGENLLLLAAGIVLVLVIFAARRARVAA